MNMKNVASRVIAKCGGHALVAKWVKVDVSQVYRWTYDKSRGGTGGVVPTRHQHELLAKARAQGIDLTGADFFDVSPARERKAS
jgi:hypothetical protein